MKKKVTKKTSKPHKTSFYEFSQNNSGGSFMVDKNVCHRLIIEADNSEEATQIAEDLGCYWDGCSSGQDCQCCGDRWYREGWKIDFKNQYRTIEKYAQTMAKEYGWTTPDVRIFFKDGKVVEFDKGGREMKKKKA